MEIKSKTKFHLNNYSKKNFFKIKLREKLGFNDAQIFEFWLQTCKEETDCLTNDE